MKKTILSITICITALVSSGQAYVQTGVGYSEVPLFEMSVGYRFNNLFLSAGHITHVSRDLYGSYLNIKIGSRINISEDYFLEPSAGYAYILKSTDKKYLNHGNEAFSLYLGKEINGHNILLGALYAGKLLPTFGIRYNF